MAPMAPMAPTSLLLLTLLPCSLLPSASSLAVVGWGAGAMAQLRETVAAGVATNVQWFNNPGGAACSYAASTSTPLPGWPGFQGGATEGITTICIRRKIMHKGGQWGPWRLVSGSIAQTWRPYMGSVIAGVRDAEFAVEDAVLNIEDAVITAAEDAAAAALQVVEPRA